MTSRRAAIRAAAAPEPAGMALWSFLWGAGCRRLHLSPRGVPLRRDLVVTSLGELLAIVEDEQLGEEALIGIEFLLRAGFLERWLRDALLQPGAAESARAIRIDERDLKVERWLQAAGQARYFIGALRIDTVRDLASLPERRGDLAALWAHIREGVPQERFKSDPATVRVLEEIRISPDLDERARPIIACLRLGLRRLPWGERSLEILEDLAPALQEAGGRESLVAILEARVLETWVEAIAPGKGALVAAARGLPPEIAADRAVRSVLGPAVYPIPGVCARDFDDLVLHAGAMSRALCSSPAARARIRDALFGPVPLPGTPATVRDPREDDLSQIRPEHQSDVFCWYALRLPILHLGAAAVRARDELVAAISEAGPRAHAVQLAAAGMLSQWYRDAIGGALPSELHGQVQSEDFPALCIAMGEPPPPVEVRWDRATATVPEGGTAYFAAEISNRDAVRTAVLALAAEPHPARGKIALEHRLVLPPGAAASVQLSYEGPRGTAGQTLIAASVSHARTGLAPIAVGHLRVIAGFPWRSVLPVVVAWAGLVGAALMFLRLAVQPFADAAIYRGGAFAPQPPSGALAAGVGLVPVALAFVLLRVAIFRRHRRLWAPPATERQREIAKWASGALSGVAVIIGISRGFDGGAIAGLIAAGLLSIKLSEVDLPGALLLGGWLAVGKDLGALLLGALGGLDAFAIMAASAFGISGATAPIAIAGWSSCGLLLGLAFGTAVALRGIHHPVGAELVRLALLGLAALWIACFRGDGIP